MRALFTTFALLVAMAVSAACDEGDFSVSEVPDSVFALMQGHSYGHGCPVSLDDLRYLRVLHVDASGEVRRGEMVCNKAIADDLIAIFRELYDARYPIERIELIDRYGADDERSMTANNTSCFNFRQIAGSRRLSRHAYGMAVDINPLYNPQVRRSAKGKIVADPPAGLPYATDRRARHPYMLVKGDAAWRAFTSRGFRWGGSWRRSKDYQHFDRLPVR